jgi:CDP-paratose 2-epimerase
LTVDAKDTMILLESARKFSPRTGFISTSTNKVDGDNPSGLPLVEIDKSHPDYGHWIDENLSSDQTKHSLFGVSKVAADAMVEEYR